MLTLDERKQLLFRRLKDDLPDSLLASEAVPLNEGQPSPVPVNEDLNAYLEDLLLLAKGVIFENRFPYIVDPKKLPDDVEPQYHMLQIRIAIEIASKEGAEGETSHSEAGISRSYSSADISTELLSQIMPMCGVL